MPLAPRLLTVRFQLGRGSFGEGGFDTVEIAGLRIIAYVEKNGVPDMNRATISIYGMTPSQMNQLSRVGIVPTAFRNNIVSLMAGTDPDNPSLVFAGGIDEAWPDYQAAPEVSFNVTAQTGRLGAMKKKLPATYQGRVDVATIMGQLAANMGYTLENNLRAPIFLDNPYLPGTARTQAMLAAEWAHIFVVFEDEGKIMALVDMDSSRPYSADINADTGMVGYPVYFGPGKIAVRTLYNPAIRFLGNVNIKSTIGDVPVKGKAGIKTTQLGTVGGGSSVDGSWRVVRLVHRLESQTPNGAWFTDVIGNLLLARPDAPRD